MGHERALKPQLLALLFTLLALGASSDRCRLQEYEKVQQLNPESAVTENGNMGHYTRIHGKTLVAGAYGQDGWRGAIYVWELIDATGQWDYKQTLLPSVREPGAYFGLNIDVWGHTIIGGAPYEAPNGFYKAGAVYVFQKQHNGLFSETTRFIPWDSQQSGYFGYALAIQSNRLVVGARFTRNELQKVPRAGKIYVYENIADSWTLVAQMRGKTRSIHWADEVRLNYNVVLAGAPRAYGGEGAAYIFHRQSNGSWSEMQELRVIGTAENPPTTNDHFGEGITISNDGAYLLAAGERRQVKNTASGAAQLYSRTGNTWIFIQHILPPRAGNLRFGQRLVARNNFIYVGAWTSPTQALNGGEVFVYSKCSDGLFSLATSLTNPDGGKGHHFGKIVDVTDDYLIVGSPKELYNGAVESGAVHVYKISNIAEGFVDHKEQLFFVNGAPEDLVVGEVRVVEIGYKVFEKKKIQFRLFNPVSKKIVLKIVKRIDSGEGIIRASFLLPEETPTDMHLRLRVGLLHPTATWKTRTLAIFASPNTIAPEEQIVREAVVAETEYMEGFEDAEQETVSSDADL